MEIIIELILQLTGWVLQVFGELLIQIIGEAIVECIGHGVREPLRSPEPVRPWLAALGYLIFGSIAGALSVWLLPNSFIGPIWLRVVNLLVSPAIAGWVMASIGKWRRQHRQETLRIETFSYAFCFAFALGIVRFFWAH